MVNSLWWLCEKQTWKGQDEKQKQQLHLHQSKIMRTAKAILRKMKIKSRDEKFRVGAEKWQELLSAL